MALYCQITGRDGQTTDIPTDIGPYPVRLHLGSCCSCVCTTFCCSGNLSSVGVDLEQDDAMSVGDLADQAVAQKRVGSLRVILIQRKYSGKWDT